jgi:hypothetical protein
VKILIANHKMQDQPNQRYTILQTKVIFVNGRSEKAKVNFLISKHKKVSLCQEGSVGLGFVQSASVKYVLIKSVATYSREHTLRGAFQ